MGDAWYNLSWVIKLYVRVTKGTTGKPQESEEYFTFFQPNTVCHTVQTTDLRFTFSHAAFLLMMSYLCTAKFSTVGVIKSKYHGKISVEQEMRMIVEQEMRMIV